MFFPTLLISPIIPYIIKMALAVFTGFSIIYLNGTYHVGQTPGYIKLFSFFNAFGGLWIFAFVSAYTEMILSGTFATWYWSLNKNAVPQNTVTSFIKITTK